MGAVSRFRGFLSPPFAAAVLTLTSCSAGGGEAASSGTFLVDARTPGQGQVFLDVELAQGQQVDLAVRVRETSGIARADLRLEYDPARVVFRGSAGGALLEQGGADPAYQVFEEVPGVLRISVVRGGPGTATAGTDDPPLVHLAFVVVTRGSAPANFRAGSFLADDQGSALTGITFYGGTFVGS